MLEKSRTKEMGGRRLKHGATGAETEKRAELKSHTSRINKLGMICCALLAFVFIFSGCKKKEDPEIQTGKATLRYETVPYERKASELVCSASSGDTNYYVFLLGHVESVPLAYRPAVYYDGVTNLTIGYSASNVTQSSISNAVTEASSHSVSVNASVSVTTKYEVEAGLGDWFKAKMAYELGVTLGVEAAKSRSISNTYDVSYSKASETKDEITATIGANNEPAGMYRYSLFTTTDVYYVVVTDKAKTRIIEDYTAFCARPTQYWKIDYDPKEGGSFGKTALGDLLEIPTIVLSQLPDPDEGQALPTLTTNAAKDVAATSATLGGNILFAGTPAYSERGVVYSTTPNPTIADSKEVIAGTGMGSFEVNVSNLTLNTTYYVRAYAINVLGTAYGEEVSFKTESTIPGQITYLDENGATQTRTIASTTRFTSSTTMPLSSGWYYMEADDWMTYSSRITVSGNVHLILEDGSKLTVNGGINVPAGDNKLTIYSQSISGNMGELTAAASSGNAGIGGNAGESNGTVIINGGNITAKGSDAVNGVNGGGAVSAARGASAGIGGGSNSGNTGGITINNGTITATGGNGGTGGNGTFPGQNAAGGGGGGAGIGGGGGNGGVHNTSGSNGGNSGDITINEGTITAVGGGSRGGGSTATGSGGGGGGGGAAAAIGGGGGGGGGGTGPNGAGVSGSNVTNPIGAGAAGGRGGGHSGGSGGAEDNISISNKAIIK